MSDYVIICQKLGGVMKKRNYVAKFAGRVCIPKVMLSAKVYNRKKLKRLD